MTHYTITVTPSGQACGASVTGLDLSRPLEPQQVAEIRAAWLEHHVLAFPDQVISDDDQERFTLAFGGFGEDPFIAPIPGRQHVIAVKRLAGETSPLFAEAWHSDWSFQARPPAGTCLYGITIPPVGGDTLFADMYAAYDGLSDEVKAKVEGKVAVHDFVNFRKGMRKRGVSEEEIAAFDRQYPKVEHPVIRTHPETGRKAIYVNAGFTQHIVGMEKAESDALLAHLYAQAAIPEYQCRFRWTKNAIAFWDNRASQHYAASDYFPAVRRMERVTVVGDRPY